MNYRKSNTKDQKKSHLQKHALVTDASGADTKKAKK